MMLHMSQSLMAELGRAELSLLDDRLAEAEEGELICASHIEEWVGSWFTDSELPPPAPLPVNEV